MADMFRNYKNENNHEVPENIIRFLKTDEKDELVVGADNIYYFRLPISIDDVENYKVSFKQGLSLVLEKGKDECEHEEYNDTSYIRCVLSPEESRLFNSYNKDTHTQLALLLVDGSILYSNKYALEVSGVLNSEAFKEGE